MTTSNSAALVKDLNYELMNAAATQDTTTLVRKLQSTTILGAECVGKEEHEKLQSGYSSALTIVNAFSDASNVEIGSEFTAMCQKLLKSISDACAVRQRQASVHYTQFDPTQLGRPRVHCFKKPWDDVEAMQSANAELHRKIADMEGLQVYLRQTSALALAEENVDLKKQISSLKEEKEAALRAAADAESILESTLAAKGKKACCKFW